MANLERLRRAYGKQVKQLRKEYAYEMEMLRVEKQRKDDARREALRIANEERRKAKAAAAQTRAAERMVFQEEFRQTLVFQLLYIYITIAIFQILLLFELFMLKF